MVLSSGVKFNLNKSDRLGEMFMPKYLILPTGKGGGACGDAAIQSDPFSGMMVDLVQFIE